MPRASLSSVPSKTGSIYIANDPLHNLFFFGCHKLHAAFGRVARTRARNDSFVVTHRKQNKNVIASRRAGARSVGGNCGSSEQASSVIYSFSKQYLASGDDYSVPAKSVGPNAVRVLLSRCRHSLIMSYMDYREQSASIKDHDGITERIKSAARPSLS